nr:tetratricopeptide repeat protein [Candidatus Sigynarchaeum springense]MDO8119655.1 tetratricopeptide repeat protein [Candidatus Sigynarchaeota archaeon]
MVEKTEPDETSSLGRKNAAYQALKSGNLEKARDLFENLSKSYPWVASFKFNLALTCFKLGQLEMALDNLNAGLASEPGDEKAIKLKLAIESRCKKMKQESKPPEDQKKPVIALDRNREDEKIIKYILEGQFQQNQGLLPGMRTGATSPPVNRAEYSSSRLMNFVIFEKQRRRTELRSMYDNHMNDEVHQDRLSWYFSDRDINEDNAVLPNKIVFRTRPKITAEFVDDLMSRIELLPRDEDTVFMDTMKSRYSYDINYIKEAINELHRSNHYKQTIQACEMYLEHFPDDLEILFVLGNLHFERGNIVQSEAAFKKILEMYYENAYAWYNLAKTYEIRGLWQLEAFCLQQAKTFGYRIDEIRLARLLIKGVPIDPFTDNVHWQ